MRILGLGLSLLVVACSQQATELPDGSATALDAEATPVGAGGAGITLELPFPYGEDWILTRAYRTGTHTQQPGVDDRFAVDFALGGCDSWTKPALAAHCKLKSKMYTKIKRK